jgi:hypothetical protein
MDTRSPFLFESKTYQKAGMKISYPLLTHLPNPSFQKRCNQKIIETVQSMIKLQTRTQQSSKYEMNGDFAIKTNERGVFSVQLTNRATSTMFNIGYTIVTTLTFNGVRNEWYELRDLFAPNVNYVFEISKHIQQQIKSRALPTLQPFRTINPNQNFYLADKILVIYFPMYQLFPADFGIPMFPIHLYELQSIALSSGPIPLLLQEC